MTSMQPSDEVMAAVLGALTDVPQAPYQIARRAHIKTHQVAFPLRLLVECGKAATSGNGAWMKWMRVRTADPEGSVVTTADVGRVFVDRCEGYTMNEHGMSGPFPVVDRYVIESVAPADDGYYFTCPDAGPRVEVRLRRILRDGGLSSGTTRRWLPTTGNTARVELEARR